MWGVWWTAAGDDPFTGCGDRGGCPWGLQVLLRALQVEGLVPGAAHPAVGNICRPLVVWPLGAYGLGGMQKGEGSDRLTVWECKGEE